MKTLHQICLAAALLAATSCANSPATIVTYNICNTKGMDKVRSAERVAGVINDLAPDFVAIQEVDSVTMRSEGVFVLEDLAQKCGMNYAYGPAIDFQGGKYGVGILSREQPLRHYNIPLPGEEEQRTLLVAEFKSLYFCCFHLSLTPKSQMESLPIIAAELAKLTDKPLYIAGDWNVEPESQFIAELSKHIDILTDTTIKTWPSDKPQITIDYIAASKANKKRARVISTEVVDETLASDHRPVIVRIR